MKYELKPTKFFLEQIDKLSTKAKTILEEKLISLKTNPFYNKRIHGQNLFLFRIRFKDNRKEKRVIYLVDKPNVIILCILDRKNNYKDLKKYLKKLSP